MHIISPRHLSYCPRAQLLFDCPHLFNNCSCFVLICLVNLTCISNHPYLVFYINSPCLNAMLVWNFLLWKKISQWHLHSATLIFWGTLVKYISILCQNVVSVASSLICSRVLVPIQTFRSKALMTQISAAVLIFWSLTQTLLCLSWHSFARRGYLKDGVTYFGSRGTVYPDEEVRTAGGGCSCSHGICH